MTAKLLDFEQGTYEWLVARIPYITASDVAKVMAGGKGVTRHNYMVKKLCERLNNEPVQGYKSNHMQNGNDNEPIARQIYEVIRKVQVTTSGFWYLEDERIGASLDGDILESDGYIEIKTVISPEQVRLITTGQIKPEYIKQMQTQMYVKGKQWCDYCSYSPGDDEYGRLPEKYQFKIIRVYRDEEMIQRIRKECAFFHHELDALLERFGYEQPVTSNT